MADLTERLRDLVRTFFPRSRILMDWTAHTAGTESLRTDRTRRHLEIPTSAAGGDLDATVLVALAQIAAGSERHTKRWRQHLEKVTARATALGRADLAERLRAEIAPWVSADQFPAAEMYDAVGDALLVDPASSFEVVQALLADNFGLTPLVMAERYPKLRAAYDRQRRLWAAEAAAEH